jgi:cell shape-determining protein MreC
MSEAVNVKELLLFSEEQSSRIASLSAENQRLRKALEEISKADFLDFSLAPARSAVPMALAALEAKP